jgi:hypothetical protein
MAYKLFRVIVVWVSEEARALCLVLFCFVLFCSVFVVVVSRVFKVPSELACREFERANCKGIQVWWVGWQKAVLGLFFLSCQPPSSS